jgi:16S rRNA (cytidine1402-2'-O)-methyltransferase
MNENVNPQSAIQNPKSSAGSLYIVATPIGNLEDITFRALRVLKEAYLVACEDTRHTAKLLTHYGITTPRKSYHEFNEESRVPELIRLLREGKNIALVGDAGTPLVSDPGYKIVSACRMEGIAVIPVPGASAAIAALSASGLPSDSFFFAGFLPSRGAARRRRLEELAGIPVTLILYEAPHRLLDSLKDMAAVLGPRRAALAREITKIHEEFLCGTLDEIFDTLRERPEIRGEITLVVESGEGKIAESAVPVLPESIREHLAEEMKKSGLSRNEALKAVARARGVSRRDAYRQLQNELDRTHEDS